jgi:hypothetical protein
MKPEDAESMKLKITKHGEGFVKSDIFRQSVINSLTMDLSAGHTRDIAERYAALLTANTLRMNDGIILQGGLANPDLIEFANENRAKIEEIIRPIFTEYFKNSTPDEL